MSGRPQLLLWRAMREQRWELAGAAALGFVAAASAVALLGTSAWLIATAAGAPPVLTLTVAAVMVRAFALARAVFRYGERLAGHDAAFRGLIGLRVRVYRQMERLAPAGITQLGRGDWLARMVGDVDAAVDLPLRVVLPWLQSALVVAGAVAFLWWLAPAAALLMALAGLAGVMLVPWLVARITARAEARLAPLRAELSSALVTAFDAAADLEVFGARDLAIGQIAAVDSRLTRLGRREALGLGLAGALVTAVQGIAVVGSLCLTIPAVTDGTLEPVWLAVAVLLPLAVFDVVAGVPAAAITVQRVRASAIRIQELATMESPANEPVHPVDCPPGFTGLRLAEVSVTWDAHRPAVLTGISLSIDPGEHVYLVGPSGAGKSTLAQVLMGFLRYSGRIGVNGVELSCIEPDELRTRVGLLEQRAHIFGTTIQENVTLGREGEVPERVEAALTSAQLDAMIARLPRGIHTPVGSFGSSISGGEAQRLALARLLAEPRPLVILDEPTEHLDLATAVAVDSVIMGQLASLTTITITHHLLTIPADARVFVLQDGRLAAADTCEELLLGGGWFAEQWEVQRDVAAVGVQVASAVGSPAGTGRHADDREG